MLGKLFKYEFKNTYKIMLTIYAVLMGVTILGAIILSTPAIQNNQIDDSPVLTLLVSSFFLLYMLSAFALFIVTYVYICIRFYKTMYSDQGYLTHTLPVSSFSIFNVKLLTSLVWTIGSLVFFILSVFLLLLGASRGELITKISYGMGFADFASEFHSVMGMSIGVFILYVIVMTVFSCLSTLLMIFASISVGQLFNQHKIVAAIVTGLVLYFVQQTFGTIILLFTSGSLFSVDYAYTETVTVADILLSPSVLGGTILSLLFTVGFYITCVVILKKHINLD